MVATRERTNTTLMAKISNISNKEKYVKDIMYDSEAGDFILASRITRHDVCLVAHNGLNFDFPVLFNGA